MRIHKVEYRLATDNPDYNVSVVTDWTESKTELKNQIFVLTDAGFNPRVEERVTMIIIKGMSAEEFFKAHFPESE